MNIWKGSGEIASDIALGGSGKFASFTVKATYEDDGRTFSTFVRINVFGEDMVRKIGSHRKGDLASVEGPLQWDKGGNGYEGKIVCRANRMAFKENPNYVPEPSYEPRTGPTEAPQMEFNADDELPF